MDHSRGKTEEYFHMLTLNLYSKILKSNYSIFDFTPNERWLLIR